MINIFKHFKILFTLVCVACACAFLGCSDSTTDESGLISQPSDLNHSKYTIGVAANTIAQRATDAYFNRAKVVHYTNLDEGYLAVQNKEIDAFVFDRHILVPVADVRKNLFVLPKDLAESSVVVAISPRRGGMTDQINKLIDNYRKDGTFQYMMKEWIISHNDYVLDISKPKRPGYYFRVATEGYNFPMNFHNNDGELVGFDIDLAKRLMYGLNGEVEFVPMDFSQMFKALEANEVDFAIANINPNPTFSHELFFSKPYVDSAVAVMIHTDNLAPAKTSEEICRPQDASGKKVGILAGTIFKDYKSDLFVKPPSYIPFRTEYEAVDALIESKVDAVMLDEPIANYYALKHPAQLHTACSFDPQHYAFALKKFSPLKARINEKLQRLINADTIGRYYAFWCADGRPDVPAVQLLDPDGFVYTGEAGVLRFAADPSLRPLCYYDEKGEAVGAEIDIIRRVARLMNYRLEFVPCDFTNLFSMLLTDKVDVIGGMLSVTPERESLVDFTISYHVGALSFLARRPKAGSNHAVESIADLNGLPVGVHKGSSFADVAAERLPRSKRIIYVSFKDMIIALKKKEIKSFLFDTAVANLEVAADPEIMALPELISVGDNAFTFPLGATRIRDDFNKVLRVMRFDGTLDALEKKWILGDPAEAVPYEPTAPTPMGVLRYASCPQVKPFCFIRQGVPMGYEVDLATMVAEKLGYSLKPLMLEFKDYLDAVAEGRVEFGFGCTTVTAKRKTKMLFSMPTYYTGVSVIILRPDIGTTKKP